MPAPIDLFALIKAGDEDGIRAALEADPGVASSVNEAGISAVLFALYHRRRDLADVLLSADPDLNVFDAVAAGERDIALSLLDDAPEFVGARGADGFTPLHLAAFFSHLDLAEALLSRKADPDAVAENPMRVRPIHSAAAAGSTPIVAALLGAGAAVDAAQEGGFTALHAAALHGNGEMVRLLLDHGADPARPTGDGRTARDLAASKKHHAVVAMLG